MNTPFSFGKFKDCLSPKTILTANDMLKQIDKADSYPFYFPEYVLHGVEHIQKVLEYAEKLIPKDSFNYILELNERAMDVLVLAVCLHDMAMFIDEQGFETLLQTEKWSNEFKEFINILKKADDKTLDRIYGSTNNALAEKVNAKILSKRDNMFDKINKYTVGEFLRKHHHAIAYDIAVNGFPCKNRYIEYFSNDKYKKIIGFIAKAHRGNLRKIIEEAELEEVVYAEQGYSPYDIPIAYLMGIIWIADEIDDKAEYRSPSSDMLDKELTEFSVKQWNDNMCVIDTTFVANKPVVFFNAIPENTNQFLRIELYCKKVQAAIDQTITAIVEFCGQGNVKFNLSVIRVKSSLDLNKEKYKFLPVDASLRINPEIFNLLVKPLYGYDKSFGVRELLANALDACYEREAVDLNYKGKAMILCNLDRDQKQFKIIDNGIGMTSNTIINYFMTVGASICNTAEWKLKHTDDSGHFNVPRLGRFGIGILSAFLLGDNIEIITRHYASSNGYKYNFNINVDIPDITIVDCPIGTQITINIPSEMEKLHTSDVMLLFPIGDKYNYGIPHYPFIYPVCLNCVDGDVLAKNAIYYYDDSNFLNEFDFDTVKIRLGSLLDTLNIVRKDMIKEGYEILDANCFEYIPSKIFSNQNEVMNYNFVSIERIYYNGMLIEEDFFRALHNLKEIGLRAKPLYLKINDNDNSASLNLKKTSLNNCKALRKAQEVISFFLIMLPLVVEEKFIDIALKKYPIDDVVARKISRSDHKKSEAMEGYLCIERMKCPDFAFAYDPDNGISQDGICESMSKTIIKWLVVSEGYEQDYKIPFDIQERRKKYMIAFAELDKYLLD